MTHSISDLPRSFENPVTCVPIEVQEAFFEKKYANLYKIFSRFGRINDDVYLRKGKDD
jgi:hypothetical protein